MSMHILIWYQINTHILIWRFVHRAPNTSMACQVFLVWSCSVCHGGHVNYLLMELISKFRSSNSERRDAMAIRRRVTPGVSRTQGLGYTVPISHTLPAYSGTSSEPHLHPGAQSWECAHPLTIHIWWHTPRWDPGNASLGWRKNHLRTSWQLMGGDELGTGWTTGYKRDTCHPNGT